MSVYGALITGVSGLNAFASNLATISDNIANANTVGYKRVLTDFSTLVTASSRAAHSPGGVSARPRYEVDRGGLLLGSTFETDLAIDGSGFFAVTDVQQRGPGDEFLFTRAGSFRPDKDGYLVNTAGNYLQAWTLDATGSLPTGATELLSLTSVNIANIAGEPSATQTAFLGATLPSSTAPGEQITTTVTVYDSLGTDHTMRITWTKGADPNVWAASVRIGDPAPGFALNTASGNSLDNAGADNDPTATGDAFDLSTLGAATAAAANQDFLRVTFNGDGTLADVEDMTDGSSFLNAVTGNLELGFGIDYDGSTGAPYAASGANDGAITLTLGGQDDSNGLAQFDVETPDPNRLFTQDGVSFGTAVGVSISEEGIITALFNNGEQQALFQIPVVRFANPNALDPKTGNVFGQTADSGDFTLSQSGQGSAGKVIAFALEGSTTDIAQEFTNLIVTQRNYSANTKVISTADEMLEELIRVKR